MEPETRLTELISELKTLGCVPAAADPFRRASQEVLRDLVDDTVSSVAAYRESRNPDLVPELERHFGEHLAHVAGLLAGGAQDFGFVVRHAQQRAQQHFPLDAGLSAYRSMNRALAEQVRDAAIDTAGKSAELRRVVALTAAFAIEYTGACASLATREYVAETRRLAEADGDRRSELLNLLLEGYDESDSRAAAVLRRAGYLAQRQSYCVVLVRSANPAEMDDASRVQRIVESLRDVLLKLPVRLLTGTRDTAVVAIVSATRRQSGWTRPHTVVSELVSGPLRLMGNAVLIGVSNDVPSTSHVPRAFIQAEQALDLAGISERIVRYADVPFVDVVVRAARDAVSTSLPAWVDELLAADGRGRLCATLDAYAANDMNVLQAAKALKVHPNTMYARFQKIASVTGKNPQSFEALRDLLLALNCRAR